jgi:uncharacterized repeat protein (TIGR01451 family)
VFDESTLLYIIYKQIGTFLRGVFTNESTLPSNDSAWGGWTTTVWTGGPNGIVGYGYPIPYYQVGDTWLGWIQPYPDWYTHYDGWLRASINIPATWIVTSVKMVDKYNPNTILSINDGLYVHVDGTYCAGGGTEGVPWVQAFINGSHAPNTPPNPNPLYPPFVPATLDTGSWPIAPATGWYLPGGLTLPASLFTPGNHEIQILTEEFDQSGGIGHPVFVIEYEERTQTQSTITTIVHDSNHNPLPINFQLPLASVVYDTAEVKGVPTTVIPTGTVTFELFKDNSFFDDDPEVAMENGMAKSKDFGPLPAGQYYFIATYNGDENNLSVTGDPETFEVLPASISIVKTGTLVLPPEKEHDRTWKECFDEHKNDACFKDNDKNWEKDKDLEWGDFCGQHQSEDWFKKWMKDCEKEHSLGRIDYIFTVTNTGSAILTNVTIADVPALTTGPVPASVESLAPLAPATFTGSYNLTQADVDAGQVVDTATATGTPPIGEIVTGTCTYTVSIPQAPAIALVKKGTLEKDKSNFKGEGKDEGEGNGRDLPKPGDKIKYDYRVTNTGNVTLNNVTVVDNPALPITPPSVPSLAPGTSAKFTASYILTQADIDAGLVKNTATATGTPLIGAAVTAQDSATVRLTQSASIDLTKKGTLDMTKGLLVDRADIGDQINYTFTVKNSGNVTLTNVTLTDDLPLTIVTPPPLTLAPGETATSTATYTLTEKDIRAGKVKNTATATGDTPGGKKVTVRDTLTVSLNKGKNGDRD